MAQQFRQQTPNPLYSLINKNGRDSGQSFGEFQTPDYRIDSDGARRLPFIGSDGTQGNLSEVSSSVGGYDPEDLAAAGYPSDARFIDAPLDRKGNRIAANAGAERTELYDGVIPLLASNGDPNSYTVPIQGLVNFTNYPVKYLPEGFLKPTDRAFYAFDSAGQAFYNINGTLTAPLAPYNVPTLNELNGEAFRTGFVNSAKAAPGAFIDSLGTLDKYLRVSIFNPSSIIEVANDINQVVQRASLLGVDGVVNSVGSGIYDLSQSISPLGVLKQAGQGNYYGAGSSTFNVGAILAGPAFMELGAAGASAAGRQYQAFSGTALSSATAEYTLGLAPLSKSRISLAVENAFKTPGELGAFDLQISGALRGLNKEGSLLQGSQRADRILEGKAAFAIRDELTDFGRTVSNKQVPFQRDFGKGGPFAEFDLGTNRFLIEVTNGTGSKASQIREKYLNPFANPDNKPVILLAPKFNKIKERSAIEAGAFAVVRTTDELVQLIKTNKPIGRKP